MDLPKGDKSLNERDELRRLREENARLKKLLTHHGITWEEPTAPAPIPAPPEFSPAPTHFSTDKKIALFRRLFRGREDAYPQRWESAKGTSGYSPACGNEWKPGICHKPRVKCGDCNQRLRLPVWNKPRIIGCAENYPQHIGLPRACLDAVLALLQENDIRPELQDERLAGRKGADTQVRPYVRRYTGAGAGPCPPEATPTLPRMPRPAPTGYARRNPCRRV